MGETPSECRSPVFHQLGLRDTGDLDLVVLLLTVRVMRRRLKALVQEVRTDLRRHDVLLAAAGLTFYALVAFVPLLLVSMWLSGLVVGPTRLRALGVTGANLLGNRPGLSDGFGSLIRAAIHPPLATLVGSGLVAAWYGEGLARALGRFSPRHLPRRGVRGRLATPVLVAASAVLLTCGLLLAQGLTDALGESDAPTLPRVYIAFIVSCLGLTLNVALCYVIFGRAHLSAFGLWCTSFLTASWIAGSALGFLLVVSWRLNVSAPFADSRTLGLAALVTVWLYLSHVALLIGYASAIRVMASPHRLDVPA